MDNKQERDKMARKKVSNQDGWNTWETIPNDGDLVIVKINGIEHHGQYFNDGNTQFDDFVMVPSDRGVSVWKPSEPKQTEVNETEPLFVEWPLSESETVAMISDWMKKQHGVEGCEWNTNIPKSILRVKFQAVQQ